MSSPRPLPPNAALADRLLRASHRHYSTGGMEPTRRMPSTRPIDRRWDHSRGIFFDSMRASIVHDFTWTPHNAIVFSDAPATRRGYAARSMFGPRSSTDARSSSVPPPSSSRHQNVLDPHKLSSGAVGDRGNLMQQLEREKKLHEETRQSASRREQDLHRHFDVEKQQVRNTAMAGVVVKETELRKEEAALEKREQAHELEKKQALQRLESKTKEMEARSAHLDRREREIQHGHAQLETTRADMRQEEKVAAESAAQQSVADEIERHRQEIQSLREQKERAKVAEEEATAVVQHYDQRKEDDDRLSAERADEEVRSYKEYLAQRYADQTDSFRRERQAGSVRREVERADYDAYHRVWNGIWEHQTRFNRDIKSLADRLTRKVEQWQDLAQSLNTESIHPWFPHKYPTLARQYQDFLDSSARDEKSRLRELEDLKDNVRTEWETLSVLAHQSRAFTRFHRFGKSPSMSTTMASLVQAQLEYPARLMMDQLDRENEQLQKRRNRSVDATDKAYLTRKIAERASQRTSVARFLTSTIALREHAELQVFPNEPAISKKIIMNTFQAVKDRVNALQQWGLYMGEHPRIDKDSDISEQQQAADRKEFRRRQVLVAQEVEQFKEFLGKMQLLEADLGQTDETVEEAASQYDSFIKEKSTQAQETFLESLRPMIPSFSRASSVPRPVRSSIVATPARAPSPSMPQKPIELQSRISALKARLAALTTSEDESEKAKVAQELRDTKLKLVRMELSAVTKRKAALMEKTPPDHAGVVRLGKAIEELSRFIARLAPSSSAVPEAPAVVEKETLDNVETSSRSGRARPLRLRKHRSERSKSPVSARSVSATPSDSPNAAPTTTRFNGSYSFRPTAVQQSPRRSWSSNAYAGTHSSAMWLEALEKTWPGTSARANEQMEHVNTELVSSVDSTASSSFPTSHRPLDEDQDYTPSREQIQMSLESNSNRALSMDAPSRSQASSDIEYSEPDQHDGDDAAADKPLTYHIPDEVFRRAAIASRSTMAAFWSHKLYINPKSESKKDESPLVHYCKNFETAETHARRFLDERILGFDIEWEPFKAAAKSTIKQSVSLIQIAAEDKIALFHISLFAGETAEQLMPPSLRTILESPAYIKAGVNIAGDAKRLRDHLHVDMRGQFELSHLYRLVQFSESEPHLVTRRLVRLADQVQNILRLPLKKDEVRVSSWSKPLTVEQSNYAATDAYAGFRLFCELDARRKGMRPAPPRPGFYEEQTPIRRGNGEVVGLPRAQSSKRKGVVDDAGKTVDDEGDGVSEEYFDTAETLEDGDESQSTLQNSGSTRTTTSTTTPLVGSHDESASAPMATSEVDPPPPSETNRPAKRGQPPASEEFTLANVWVTATRASLPIEYNLKVGNPQLRAYYLWHEEGLDCAQVAAVLGDPPLKTQTVVGYVMDVLRHENFPFDKERAREVFDLLPKSAQGRYAKVVERMGGS